MKFYYFNGAYSFPYNFSNVIVAELLEIVVCKWYLLCILSYLNYTATSWYFVIISLFLP